MTTTTCHSHATTSDQATVWQAIRDHTAEGTSTPLSCRELADRTGLTSTTLRNAIRALARRGLLHIDRRTTTTGAPAPSRYMCTAPAHHNTHRHLDHLMRSTPRSRWPTPPRRTPAHLRRSVAVRLTWKDAHM
jgi:DNA-binding FadR family transcriptional regulator